MSKQYLDLGGKCWKLDTWNIDSLVYVPQRSRHFFSFFFIPKSVPNGDFSLKSGYKVHTYWTHFGMFAQSVYRTAFSTCVTHIHLKCEPHVLFPATVQLCFFFFNFNAWDLRNYGQFSHCMKLLLYFVFSYQHKILSQSLIIRNHRCYLHGFCCFVKVRCHSRTVRNYVI